MRRAMPLAICAAGIGAGCSAFFPLDNLPVRRWCLQQEAGYRTCSDFDTPNLTDGFDRGLVTDADVGGSFALSDADDAAPSPPQVGVGTANATAPFQSSAGLLVATLWPPGPAPSSVECRLQVRPIKTSSASGDNTHVYAVHITDAQGGEVLRVSVNMFSDAHLYLVAQSGSANLFSGRIYGDASLTGFVSSAISITIGAGTVTFDADFDGGVPDGGAVTKSVTIPTTSQATLEVGPGNFAGSSDASSSGWQFHYDNVICY